MQWEKGAKTGSDFFVFMSVFGVFVFYEIEMDRIYFSCVSFWPQFILCKLESYFLVFYESILSRFTACIESDNLGLLSFFLMNRGALGSSLMMMERFVQTDYNTNPPRCCPLTHEHVGTLNLFLITGSLSTQRRSHFPSS